MYLCMFMCICVCTCEDVDRQFGCGCSRSKNDQNDTRLRKYLCVCTFIFICTYTHACSFTHKYSGFVCVYRVEGCVIRLYRPTKYGRDFKPSFIVLKILLEALY